jgi:hypothetical protein
LLMYSYLSNLTMLERKVAVVAVFASITHFGLRGSSPPSDAAKQTDKEPFYPKWREGNSLLQLP